MSADGGDSDSLARPPPVLPPPVLPPRVLPHRPKLSLRLVVAGGSRQSRRAILNLRRLCAHHLPECEVEVADLYRAPGLARDQGVVAAPTLLRLSPLPVRRIVGDLADAGAVLRALGLDSSAPPPPPA
jgi:hypothetical protein